MPGGYVPTSPNSWPGCWHTLALQNAERGMAAGESTSTGIDNDKIAVQEAKPAQINDLGAVHYLSPEVASTVLWRAARLRKGNAEVVSAHVDLRTATHFAERERIRRCVAEEVRGRRAQLVELRQKQDSHTVTRDAMRRQLLEKIAHGVELVGLRCAEQMSREAAEAVRALRCKEYHEIDLILRDEEALIVLYPRGMKILPHAYEVPVLPLLKKWFPEADGSTDIGSSP